MKMDRLFFACRLLKKCTFAFMDIDGYIASGILENYCLGICSDEERTTVEQYSTTYPVIRKEIENIRLSLEDYFKAKGIRPAPSVKIAVMQSIYKQIAASDPSYPPLIDGKLPATMMVKWIAAKDIPKPEAGFENLYVADLPSTNEVTNFFVHAKYGHEEEMHEDFIEYLYVIRGSCTMDFDGEKRSYREGDIISIMPHIRHSATVTSNEPMIALVQRQVCA